VRVPAIIPPCETKHFKFFTILYKTDHRNKAEAQRKDNAISLPRTLHQSIRLHLTPLNASKEQAVETIQLLLRGAFLSSTPCLGLGGTSLSHEITWIVRDYTYVDVPISLNILMASSKTAFEVIAILAKSRQLTHIV
jgi:hypothetical protein